jgi:hypothetical protein
MSRWTRPGQPYANWIEFADDVEQYLSESMTSREETMFLAWCGANLDFVLTCMAFAAAAEPLPKGGT